MTGSEGESGEAPSIPNSNDNCFVEDVPEYCVWRLPCGHHFHPVAVLCHMVVNGMNCPVCRWVRQCLPFLLVVAIYFYVYFCFN